MGKLGIFPIHEKVVRIFRRIFLIIITEKSVIF